MTLFQTQLPSHRKLSHPVAFRLTDSEYLELLPFFEAFETASFALRWLLNEPEVKEKIRQAVEAANGG